MREALKELQAAMKRLAEFDTIASERRESGGSLGDTVAMYMSEARSRYTLAMRKLAIVLEETRKMHGLATV